MSEEWRDRPVDHVPTAMAVSEEWRDRPVDHVPTAMADC